VDPFDNDALRQIREMSKQLDRDMAIAKPHIDAVTAAMRDINDGPVGRAMRDLNEGPVAQVMRDLNRLKGLY
jgi:hypothetical protein